MYEQHDSLVPDLREDAPWGGRAMVLLVVASAALTTAMVLSPPEPMRRILLGIGATVLVVTILASAWRALARWSRRHTLALLGGFIARDSIPAFVTDSDGALRVRNAAAAARFGKDEHATLASALRDRIADPGNLLHRLQSRACTCGAAREEVATTTGGVQVAVHRLGSAGFLWRLEDVPEPRPARPDGDVLPIPLITVGRAGSVLSMNGAARALVGRGVKSLDRLFTRTVIESGDTCMIGTRSGPVEVVVHCASDAPDRHDIYMIPVNPAGGAGRDAFDALPVPMLRIAPDGKIEAINGTAAEFLGESVSPGTPIGQVMHGLGRPVADWLRDTIRGRGAKKTEFLRLARPDQDAFVQVALSRLSETEGVIAILSDATELKTLEAQFVQSQKMQAIGQLAGGIAHDFNNLLTAISGHCDLLLLRHDQGDQDYGDLVQINQNANRAAALVSQLLAFSRKQTLRPENLDLRDTLADLTHLLNRLVGERITLTLSHDPVLRPIRADKRQIEQVLMNLVVNARDAMPQGGEIRIETEVLVLDRALARDRASIPAGEYVVVKVSDQGTGIASDKLTKVFEPFYTTKRAGEGTGLGLSTVYGIVKQTGGFIFVDSVLGQGTEFTLYFPACDSDIEDVAEEPRRAVVVAPRKTDGVVLLVEDEAPVRAFASRALRLCGFTVLEAGSGEEALDILADSSLEIDVFVTDVVMPGLDGPGWVRRALETRPGARVVFMSGYAEGVQGETGIQVANSVFLPKPFSLAKLTETVQQQMA